MNYDNLSFAQPFLSCIQTALPGSLYLQMSLLIEALQVVLCKIQKHCIFSIKCKACEVMNQEAYQFSFCQIKIGFVCLSKRKSFLGLFPFYLFPNFLSLPNSLLQKGKVSRLINQLRINNCFILVHIVFQLFLV